MDPAVLSPGGRRQRICERCEVPRHHLARRWVVSDTQFLDRVWCGPCTDLARQMGAFVVTIVREAA